VDARTGQRNSGADGVSAGYGENGRRGAAARSADYLVKGFELEELRQRVANLLKLASLEKENDALRRRLTSEGQFGR